MKQTIIKNLLFSILLLSASTLSMAVGNTYYIHNRYPLANNPYLELPIGDIKPQGWLLEQLRRQKTGLTGNLDEVYPQVVGKRNAWLGGDGDTWERGPYWIDGLLPLSYLLDDSELKEKAQVWVDCILNSQKEDGYFGPDKDYPYEAGLQRNNSHDWWPKMVALKILKQHYMATKDERVIPFLTKYFQYQLEMLPKYPLGHWTFWGQQRGGDNLDVVLWLYNLTGEEFLLKLGELIHSQSTPWTEYFSETDHLYRQNSLHCVNLGQGFKEPAIYYQQSKDRKYLETLDKAHKTISTTIGLPTGLWAGDELLHYGDPIRGSELCTAVEMMFSLENILRISGDMQWADYLERVAYNALPTQANDDYTARQYFQQTNQIRCDRSWRPFSTAHGTTDQVFGTLNGYPCCTCNMHQGWPKFVQNLWYATVDEGAAALVYAPSEVKIQVADGTEVIIQEETFYPFDETISFRISFPDKKTKSASFPLHLRIPEWCDAPQLSLNGEPLQEDMHAGQSFAVRRKWNKGDVLTLQLPAHVRISRWYDYSAVVERGPLIYALRMNEKWEKKDFAPEEHIAYGKWYYQVTSDTPWNYALISRYLNDKELDNHFRMEKSEQQATYPWNVENAPLHIHTQGVQLQEWTELNGSTGPINYLNQMGVGTTEDLKDLELIPYGCTTLRITEFPVRDLKKY